MNVNKDVSQKKTLGSKAYKNLRVLYIAALSTIAFIIVVNQLLVQNFISKQAHDARIVNIAGRQRMLSQKLSKIVLSFSDEDTLEERIDKRENLKETVGLLVKAHIGLQFGDNSLQLPGKNSEKISTLLKELEPTQKAITGQIHAIISLLHENPTVAASQLKPFVNEILKMEPEFLNRMEAIVFQYDREAKMKVNGLKTLEMWLMFISLLILLVEILFIFRPATVKIKNTVFELVQSENNAKKLASELGNLYESVENAHKEISDIYFAVDAATIFAKATKDGEIFHVSEKFKQLALIDDAKLKEPGLSLGNISSLIVSRNQKSIFPEALNSKIENGEVWHEEVMVKTTQKTFVWLDMAIVPVMNEKVEVSQLLVICTDITERKAAEEALKKLNTKTMEKKIKEQKQSSMLILEGQEEERNRIARDIHDGIGQMLTALKFNTESIDLRNIEKAKEKITGIKASIGEVIKEVRKVSFNLAPSVLSDYGIVAVVKNLASEITKLTGKKVEFKNYTGFDQRLPHFIETNLYRIIQEAVNNALKYAEPENIFIALYHDQIKLYIQIIDDGKGFNTDVLNSKESDNSLGHGISNMKERVSLFNGTFTLSSDPGKGTKISIEAPLNKYL